MKTETEIKKELRQLQALKRKAEKEFIPLSPKQLKQQGKAFILHKALRDVIMSYQAQIDMLKWALKPSEGEEKVLQLKRLSAMAIRKIPKAEAMKIKDREGFVEVIGFGKIHINNWK